MQSDENLNFKKLRSLELFSGAGGLALGLEQAGFDGVGFVERDTNAVKTLRLNRPDWNVLDGDVRDIDYKQFSDVDLVAGGPPCQPFSMGGKAKGKDDSRDMFPEAVRAVRELQPRAFIFENVRGLMRPAFKNYVEFIRLQMTYPQFPVSRNVDWETNYQRLIRHHTSKRSSRSLTYKVSMQLVDAADYGVPQRRHRVFFVGFRSDVDAAWHFPSPTHSLDELLVQKYVSHQYWKMHGIRVPKETPDRLIKRISQLENDTLGFDTIGRWQTVRDAISDLPEPSKTAGGNGDHRLQTGARSYPGHTGSPYDEPSKALKAGDHGVPGGENMLRYLNGKVRYFTVRESARIQTFPDEYKFHGSWTESMRQLGNAVPVKLAYAVAASVALRLKAHGQQPLQSARQTKSR